MANNQSRHYFKLFARLVYLATRGKSDCAALVNQSYNSISSGYDQSWTCHMRDLTNAMIDSLSIPTNADCLDLTCGTGYATNRISQKTSGKVIGVDRSEGMLKCAIDQYGQRCEFVQSDILEYLRNCPAESFDLVTCCWGLGYSKPLAVLRQIRRILKPNGQIAIIDNSLFSLKEILFCSFLTFAESPDKLANLMRFRFLPNSWYGALLMKLARLKVTARNDGEKSYAVATGHEAIARLRATGAAAGFEYAADEADSQMIFDRFAEIIEQKHQTTLGINIVHRYLMVTGKK